MITSVAERKAGTAGQIFRSNEPIRANMLLTGLVPGMEGENFLFTATTATGRVARIRRSAREKKLHLEPDRPGWPQACADRIVEGLEGGVHRLRADVEDLPDTAPDGNVPAVF
jgi:hypothetical protein